LTKSVKCFIDARSRSDYFTDGFGTTGLCKKGRSNQTREFIDMTKTLTKVLVAFISILFIASMAFAGTCESKAAAKKLVGDAKKIFIKKCIDEQ
jgi:hypothetical protein